MSTVPTDRYIEALHRMASGALETQMRTGEERAARAMGLVHSLNDFRLFDGATPMLLSPRRIGKAPTAARTFAGTQDDVFLYVGPPMNAQPERPGILVFHAGIETAEMVATPWDSGGLHRRRAKHLSETERRALIRERTMLAPDYRRALEATLRLRFGGVACNYLDSCIIHPADPDNVYQQDQPASFTYEVRVPGQLNIQVKELALVAMRRDYVMTDGVRHFRRWCMDNGVRFVVVDEHSPPRNVRDVVLDFAKSLVGES